MIQLAKYQIRTSINGEVVLWNPARGGLSDGSFRVYHGLELCDTTSSFAYHDTIVRVSRYTLDVESILELCDITSSLRIMIP